MISKVTRATLPLALTKLSFKDTLVFDCETTGLKPYHDAKIFSLAIADLEGNAWYFNFKEYKDLSPEYVLNPSDLKPLMQKERAWIAHNAKFDLHFTDKAGIKPCGQIEDTEVLARLFENHHAFKTGGYSLDACAKRWLDIKKDDRVKTWMDENGAYSMMPNPEGRDHKHYYFDLVPFELISEYACQDAIVTASLWKFLNEKMYDTQSREIESELIPVLFEMEKGGIRIDRAYCEKAYAFEKERMDWQRTVIEKLTGNEFVDSAKHLSPLLEERGFIIPETEKGNPQVTDEVLSQKPDDDLAKAILILRDATKRATTYWSNYLNLADVNDVIHPNFRQSGTVTGRMSCNSPNLQNIPAEDNSDFPIRRAFVPSEGFQFLAIDYAQMEFRLMLEYAQEHSLIEKIKQGLDPHDSTAELTGLSRKAAKTLNFGLLYGMGIAKLAQAIGVSNEEAKQFKNKYFAALPGVKGFIRESSRRMEMRGYTFNWAGRRYILDDVKWSYKAANSIIQGGCADIAKLAMVRLAKFLKDKKSRMVLQVHDEVLFEIHETELDLAADLRTIMESAFVAKHMPLSSSTAQGFNFHDMDEDESKDETGKDVSNAGEPGS